MNGDGAPQILLIAEIEKNGHMYTFAKELSCKAFAKNTKSQKTSGTVMNTLLERATELSQCGNNTLD